MTKYGHIISNVQTTGLDSKRERGGLVVESPGARGLWFDTYLCHVMSLSNDTFIPRKVLVIHRKRWLCPDMTEKLLTWVLSIDTNIHQLQKT